MKIVFPYNLNKSLCTCGDPTNLYILDNNKEIQLYTGDEVLVYSWDAYKLAVVVDDNGLIKTCTNKEVRAYYETEDKNKKIVIKDIKLIRGYKEYKDGDEVAKGRKSGGFIIKIKNI